MASAGREPATEEKEEEEEQLLLPFGQGRAACPSGGVTACVTGNADPPALLHCSPEEGARGLPKPLTVTAFRVNACSSRRGGT